MTYSVLTYYIIGYMVSYATYYITYFTLYLLTFVEFMFDMYALQCMIPLMLYSVFHNKE